MRPNRRAAPLLCATFAVAFATLAACSKESEQTAPAPNALASGCAPGMHEERGRCVSDFPPPPADSASAQASASASASGPMGRCPDPANADKVLAFDWQKELSVEPPLAAKLRALAAAAAETKALSVEVENELKAACSRLAVGLGNRGPFGGADVSCQAAADSLRAAREKLGPGAKVVVQVHAPICPELQSDMEECAKVCSANEPGEPAKCIGAQVGKCAAGCDGLCELKGPSKCDAVCVGKCGSGFSGKCAGVCKGKCDGKEASKDGTCAGKCEGSCEGTANGECKGACEGGCQGKAVACTGVCTGKCPTPLTEVACNGVLSPVNVGAECSAACTTRVVRKAACTLPSVNVTVTGAKDLASGTTYESAIEHALPHLLRIERRLRGRVEAVLKNQKIVGDGLKDASQHGLAPNPTGCLISVEKAVTEGVTTLSADFRAASLVTTLAQGK